MEHWLEFCPKTVCSVLMFAFSMPSMHFPLCFSCFCPVCWFLCRQVCGIMRLLVCVIKWHCSDLLRELYTSAVPGTMSVNTAVDFCIYTCRYTQVCMCVYTTWLTLCKVMFNTVAMQGGALLNFGQGHLGVTFGKVIFWVRPWARSFLTVTFDKVICLWP